ncbi:MAG: hypothetical protein K0R09_79 [Clostridiales bacterium]|jgi:hypothetical protein|nr:hypothetical protein [Clostridiales bacterium]
MKVRKLPLKVNNGEYFENWIFVGIRFFFYFVSNIEYNRKDGSQVVYMLTETYRQLCVVGANSVRPQLPIMIQT